MGEHGGEEDRSRHARDGHVGEGENSGRARLIVDRRELAEEISGGEVAQQQVATRDRLYFYLDHPADDKEHVVARVLVVDDPAVGRRPPPYALAIELPDRGGIQRPEQAYFRQRFGLSAHMVRAGSTSASTYCRSAIFSPETGTRPDTPGAENRRVRFHTSGRQSRTYIDDIRYQNCR